MFKLNKVALITASMFAANAAVANDMIINVGSNDYEVNVGPPLDVVNTLNDANFTTGSFIEFGFTGLLATSVYDVSENPNIITGAAEGNGAFATDIFGRFIDTNRSAELLSLGIPIMGPAIDGVTPLSFTTPLPGQVNIDALNPIVPPNTGTPDSEGFGLTWDLKIDYTFEGNLTATGPKYDGGTFNITFDDFSNNANDRVVISGELHSSSLLAADLILFSELTFAETGFLLIDDGTGTFLDAGTTILGGGVVDFRLDTNVDPPIPTADQLMLIEDGSGIGAGDGTYSLVRQQPLDGSITGEIVPEPTSLALMGLGLLGFSASRRKKA